MNTASWIVLVIVLVITAFIIFYLMRHKKGSCGGDCNHCGFSSCEHQDIYEQFYKDHPKEKD